MPPKTAVPDAPDATKGDATTDPTAAAAPAFAASPAQPPPPPPEGERLRKRVREVVYERRAARVSAFPLLRRNNASAPSTLASSSACSAKAYSMFTTVANRPYSPA